MSTPTPNETARGGQSPVLWFFLGVLLTANIGLVGYLLLGGGDDAEVPVSVALAPVSTTTVATTSAVEATSSTTAAPVDTSTTTTTTTTEAPTETTVPTTTLVPLDELPPRGAVYRDGTLFLEGAVPSADIAQQFIDRAAEVIGAENVVDNYVIRADAPTPTDGNVRVEQAVLFESGSARIAPEFEPILGLGVAVMTLNPQVRMVVEGHTDDVGSDELNLALSQARAEAAVAWMVANGDLDPSRFEALGLGETEPVVANDTPEQRQVNRRIEVQLLDLLLPAE